MSEQLRPDYDGSFTPWVGVRDLQKSIEWYSQMVGLEADFIADRAGWCELSIGVKKVAIGLYKVVSPSGNGGATLTFGVRDLDAERSRLEELGVRFDGPTMTISDLVRIAVFFDLDENRIMFSQPLREMRH